MKKQIFLLFLFISSIFTGRAAIETYSNRIEGSQISASASYETYDGKFHDMENTTLWPSLFTNYKVRNRVTLGINPEVLQTQDYSGSVDIQIDYKTWDAINYSFVTHQVTRTLQVDYSATDGYASITDLSTAVFEDAHYIKVTVTAITGLDVQDLFLESVIEAERYYAFDGTVMQNLGHPANTAQGTVLNISWNYLAGAESYELEWVHITATRLPTASRISSTWGMIFT